MLKRKRKRQRHHYRKDFLKWVSGFVRRLKRRKRRTLVEGIRLMTPDEDQAAHDAVSLPREKVVMPEVPALEPIDFSAEAYDIPPYAPIEVPLPIQADQRQNYKKRKPKRWWHLFGHSKNKGQVSLEQALLMPLRADKVAKPKIMYREYIRPAINSTALFVLAYLIVWLTYQLAVMVQASLSHIDSVLYYYEVMFPIGNYSRLWSSFNIILITIAGPLLSVFMGILYYYVFLGRRNPGPQMRLFLVWLYLLSMAFFFGAFVAGMITHQGFGYVADWLYMNIVFRIGVSLIFLLILGFMGWNAVKLLPEVSGPDSFKRSRTAFVLSRLSVPWLIGSALMFLLRRTSFVPQHPNILAYDLIIIGSMAFPVIAAIFNKRERPRFFKNSHRSTSTGSIMASVIAAIVLAFLVRVGLSDGLYFQFRISLDVGKYHSAMKR